MARRIYIGTAGWSVPRASSHRCPLEGTHLQRYARIYRCADPAISEESSAPGGWDGIAYFRLHGSPRTYWSRYEATYLTSLTTRVRQIAESVDVWCIFDNTASGAAIENAWELQQPIR